MRNAVDNTALHEAGLRILKLLQMQDIGTAPAAAQMLADELFTCPKPQMSLIFRALKNVAVPEHPPELNVDEYLESADPIERSYARKYIRLYWPFYSQDATIIYKVRKHRRFKSLAAFRGYVPTHTSIQHGAFSDKACWIDSLQALQTPDQIREYLEGRLRMAETSEEILQIQWALAMLQSTATHDNINIDMCVSASGLQQAWLTRLLRWHVLRVTTTAGK